MQSEDGLYIKRENKHRGFIYLFCTLYSQPNENVKECRKMACKTNATQNTYLKLVQCILTKANPVTFQNILTQNSQKLSDEINQPLNFKSSFISK